MPIPAFRSDGYLPEGVHEATEQEVMDRFGQAGPRRQYLSARLRRWLQLARAVGAPRFLVDGSFVTSKGEPGDIDAVVWVPSDLRRQIAAGRSDAIELDIMLRTREPEELFAAHAKEVWDGWVGFFGHTREADGRRKGIVEVRL